MALENQVAYVFTRIDRRSPAQTSFTTFCSGGTRYGTSSAATSLVENINSSSLLEIQDNNSVSGSAFKNA